MNNKEIKFDILENADLEKIEQIGINENMLDDDAKNRMFSYAQDKYKKLSGKNTTEKQNDSKEYVCGVEKADKRKTSRILMTVCSVAASFALIFGITVILKGNLSKPPVTPDPLDTTATTVVTTDMTVKTSETTGKTTETTVTTEELSNFNNYDSQILERETERVLKEFTGRTDEVFTDIQYAQADLNGDAVPELVITSLPFSGDYRSFLYFFNGSEYVQSDEKLNKVKYIADSKLLITYGKNQRYALFEVSSDNQLTVIEDLTKDNEEHYYDAVDEFCRKYELGALEYTNYHWQEFSYTFYAESNEAYVENPL